ncbi:hypothetical protein Anapl_04977 [Anas platyrhynchos]|uniref:Uncharacterized protein n=1 Tax=Anas platyrhynchos TaxID=8839 RepID=R0LB12_ANAPL|nr:hypothetical protein Anapl_04977 [Anas platyrhynchos]
MQWLRDPACEDLSRSLYIHYPSRYIFQLFSILQVHPKGISAKTMKFRMELKNVVHYKEEEEMEENSKKTPREKGAQVQTHADDGCQLGFVIPADGLIIRRRVLQPDLHSRAACQGVGGSEEIVAKATVQKVGSVEDAASSELMAQVLSYSEQMGSSALSANMILLSLVKTFEKAVRRNIPTE